jgi:hypothetical protein
MLPDPSRPGQPEAHHARAVTGRPSLVVILATAALVLAAAPAFADLAPDPDPGSSSPGPDPAPVATQPQTTPKPAPKPPQTPAALAPPVRAPTQTVDQPPARRAAPAPSPVVA